MQILQKINIILHRWKPTPLESEGYEKALLWMDSLPKPSNQLESSYNQYLCQCYYLSTPFIFIRDIMCFFLYIVFLFRPNDNLNYNNEPSDIGFIGSNILLPNEVHCKKVDGFEKFHLTYHERKEFIKELMSYRMNYYFKLKLLVKIGTYSFYIKTYRPRIIYCSCEYSFTSSYLTLFCNRRNVLHYNVQHGEELPCLQSSFYIFDRMYFWHERYIRYSQRVHSNIKEYRLFSPTLLKKTKKGSTEKYDYKYYLQNQKIDVMWRVFEIMSILHHKGYKVAVRMHPAYRCREIERCYQDLVEDPDKPIEQSILETKNGISLYSTVLLQIEEAGKGLVIDDLSNPVVYENLKRIQYHYITEKKLSEIYYGSM